MRTITINIKYEVGDKVWIMKNNNPACFEVARIEVSGGRIEKNGTNGGFGVVRYYLSNDEWTSFFEEDLCDTFDELRDKVFSEGIRNSIEQDLIDAKEE